MRFLPAGRVQNAMGAARQTTAFNCFVVSSDIEDDMESIMEVAAEAAETMRAAESAMTSVADDLAVTHQIP